MEQPSAHTGVHYRKVCDIRHINTPFPYDTVAAACAMYAQDCPYDTLAAACTMYVQDCPYDTVPAACGVYHVRSGLLICICRNTSYDSHLTILSRRI